MIEDREQIEKGLRQILESELDNPAARMSVVRAGVSADQTFAPLLKEIAEATSKDRNRKVTFDALYSLWQLGEPREYFLENARSHQQNKWLAYYTILILGSDPDDEKTIEALNEVKAVATDNQIRGAIAEAERVRFLAGEYRQQNTAQQRSSFLLANFRSNWNPITLGEAEIGSPANPLALWSQKKLFELSQESPEAVAQAVFEIDLAKDYGSDSFTKSYRAHVAQFLSEEARARLQQLEEQATR
jgi:hypothetical protein